MPGDFTPQMRAIPNWGEFGPCKRSRVGVKKYLGLNRFHRLFFYYFYFTENIIFQYHEYKVNNLGLENDQKRCQLNEVVFFNRLAGSSI